MGSCAPLRCDCRPRSLRDSARVRKYPVHPEKRKRMAGEGGLYGGGTSHGTPGTSHVRIRNRRAPCPPHVRSPLHLLLCAGAHGAAHRRGQEAFEQKRPRFGPTGSAIKTGCVVRLSVRLCHTDRYIPLLRAIPSFSRRLRAPPGRVLRCLALVQKRCELQETGNRTSFSRRNDGHSHRGLRPAVGFAPGRESAAPSDAAQCPSNLRPSQHPAAVQVLAHAHNSSGRSYSAGGLLLEVVNWFVWAK